MLVLVLVLVLVGVSTLATVALVTMSRAPHVPREMQVGVHSRCLAPGTVPLRRYGSF